MRWAKFLKVLSLLIIETVLQVLYLSIKKKYVEPYHSYNSYFEIAIEQVKYFASVKIAICLPVYSLFYLFSKQANGYLRISFQHSMIFFLVCLFSIFFPWGMAGDFLELIFLTLAAFLSSLFTNAALQFRRDSANEVKN